MNITTAPKYALRGHQLGYRPKTNSYDGWSVALWEQYIRDLAVFGTNAVELIPPRSDDAADSPLFPLPPMQMMIEMSRLLDEYGLDVWIWYPALDKDYSDPKTVEFALNEWGEVFQKLPRIDAVFVPGGDPGHTQPKFLMALLEKETQGAAPVSSEGADVGLAAGIRSAMAGRISGNPESRAAGVAERRGVRSASADQPGGAARESAEALSDSPLSGHHAQPAIAISGARLGRRLRGHRRPRGDQSAADG